MAQKNDKKPQITLRKMYSAVSIVKMPLFHFFSTILPSEMCSFYKLLSSTKDCKLFLIDLIKSSYLKLLFDIPYNFSSGLSPQIIVSRKCKANKPHDVLSTGLCTYMGFLYSIFIAFVLFPKKGYNFLKGFKFYRALLLW